MFFKKTHPENEINDCQDYILIAYRNGLYVLVKKIGDINFIYENYPEFFVDYKKIDKRLIFEVTNEQIS
ncbi:hypothetical protein AYY17_03290 [Morganella psychrotolerans]|uniref:Uncharacterized protein n=1 Tax=Morganella psychrotolerans TaxID=368603 RepID=A0A1B8HR40_9GAMM|nr:hypothetical protein AYY17_03290 [Morganella psychrotolerans]